MKGRAVRMGLATVLGLARRGFFIPYRYADRLPPAGEVASYGPIQALLEAAEPDFARLLDEIDARQRALEAIGGEPPPAPRFDQDWFPPLDAAAAYTIVRTRAPARIIEIGSGHSTRFLARAIADGGLACALTAIDPAPRATLRGLPIRLIERPLGLVEPGLFATLRPGDVLSVDSSHILMPGTDVDDVINRILPDLPSGVLVHFHDIFLAADYPLAWAWRGYNEQNAVAVLLGSRAWRPIFASAHVRRHMGDRLAASPLAPLPGWPGPLAASLWLEKS